jgi:membrane protein DedA with SNARE-associated domain
VTDVDRAQLWFKRRGRWAVLIGRMIPGVRTFVSLPAGFSAMPWATFVLYSMIGTLAWTAALVYAGAILQANFGVVARYIDIATHLLIAAVAVILVVRYLRCFRAPA